VSDQFGFNTGYIETLYAQYLEDPNSVSESWREFFADYRPSESFLAARESQTAARGNGEVQPVAPPAPRAKGDGAPAKPAEPPAVAKEEVKLEPLKGPAARLAQNMEASLSVPTATSVRHVPVKLMAENRRLINQYQRYIGGDKVSFTHIIGWAVVQALKKFPNMNTSYRRDNGTAYHVIPRHINLGIAVDIQRRDGSRFLLVPNIKRAESMNFAQFLGAYNDIIRRARTGKLEVADFEGTTASLTNPGMIGTNMSVPRLMPGQGVIVAVGAIGYPTEYFAIPPDIISRVGLSQVMTITSTYDHRVIQGAESGAFLSYISELLLGQHGFYQQIFQDLRIPNPPFALQPDSTPLIGRLPEATEMDLIRKQARVLQLIRAYRVRGHLIADINPLEYTYTYHPELDPATYGLTIWDLDRNWITDGLAGKDLLPLREILDILWETYARHVGVEYMHISDPREKRWLQERIEPQRMADPISPELKRRILFKLNAAEAFERFLHTKYIGHKRFSLEGAETLIPMLDMLLSDAADQGAQEVVMGMAHRGRLNVLANIFNKPYEVIFSEFEGNLDPNIPQGSGDVKYHLGARGVHVSPNGSKINIRLASNPSHLESVDPVVEGMARALQDRNHDETRDSIIPVLIHGDAAFAGQGVVAETLNMSQVRGFTTGGTVHIVINNQIGFTTKPEEARSSTYATDIARMIQAPIFHVNGDDPEAAIRVVRLALDYRQVFNKDVVIDLVCYRRHGHNEADDPSYTQPILYRKIEQHRSVRKLYTELLLRRGDLTPEEAEEMLKDYRKRLEEAFERTRSLEAPSVEKLLEKRRQQTSEIDLLQPVFTGAPREELDYIVKVLTHPPEHLHVHPRLLRQIRRREKEYFTNGKIDWPLAEALAFGTLLLEGTPVRLTGQDSRRGTFSQRHAVYIDQETEEEYIPLNNLREGQAPFYIYDSILSEFGVLGFEYGYSVIAKDALVCWEAQFGDFANGAQVIIDQYIASAEIKWGQVSGLVLLLPHGYEGQGPEHSSARIERFLELCAEQNMQVCNFTTPANYFHGLRRQIKRGVLKPLVVFTPKSLLRHPMVVSSPDDLVNGRMLEVIPATSEHPEHVKRHIFCSGKVYYDLIAAMEKEPELKEVLAITRVEQYYPFPEPYIREELERFAHTDDVVWVQEEPQNMGAWTFMQPRFNRLLMDLHGDCCREIRYVGRAPSASPATGSAQIHAFEQEQLVREALTL